VHVSGCTQGGSGGNGFKHAQQAPAPLGNGEGGGGRRVCVGGGGGKTSVGCWTTVHSHELGARGTRARARGRRTGVRQATQPAVQLGQHGGCGWETSSAFGKGAGGSSLNEAGVFAKSSTACG
jgi:hypothetical protein